MEEIIGITLLGLGFGCEFKMDTKSEDSKEKKSNSWAL